MVGLTALAVLTGDARLALTLSRADVTLPIGGSQSMAVTPDGKHEAFMGKRSRVQVTFSTERQHVQDLVGMLRVVPFHPGTFCGC